MGSHIPRVPRSVFVVEAAAMLLEAAGGRLPVTSLMKALFYFDLRCLRDAGELPTGQTFLALPAGPVVARYQKRVVGELESRGLALQDAEDDGSKPVCLIRSLRSEDTIERFGPSAREIGRWARHRTPKELSDFSHQNVGWKIAWDAGLGSERPARPISMRIAMQQLLDVDPWLDEPPNGEEVAAFLGADTGEAVEW